MFIKALKNRSGAAHAYLLERRVAVERESRFVEIADIGWQLRLLRRRLNQAGRR